MMPLKDINERESNIVMEWHHICAILPGRRKIKTRNVIKHLRIQAALPHESTH
jgi:hypothetical protein